MKIAQLFDIRGKRALVTGGASGLGFAMAEVMRDNGASVGLIDWDRDGLVRAARHLGGAAAVPTAVADISKRAEIGAATDAIAEALGGLDIAFVNAGVSGGPGFIAISGERNPDGAIENIPVDHWRRNVAINLTGAAYSLQAVVPHLKKAGGGRIIVTASLAGVKTESFVGPSYVASKAGVAHLVHQAALELVRHNILVNGIAPGAFLTGIANGRMAQPDVKARFVSSNPMHRMAAPEDIKGIALLLASPASGYMTGGVYSVDGGGAAGTAD
jgi:NAD(P)-dependent dehydrogenase (short-subunit alcohol dehydrogenase family)